MFSKIKDFSELVVFQHTIFSSAFMLIAMIVAARGWFGFDKLALCAVALIAARNFAMAFNRFCDADIDAKNPRTKDRPSVDGRISSNMILGFVVINAVLFILSAYLINSLATKLSLPFLFILMIYSFFKRFSVLAHFILGVSLSLAPIAGVIAIANDIPLWSVMLAIGVLFWVAGFDLLYSIQDIEYDKEHNLFSFPARYGLEATKMLSISSHIIAVIFWALFAFFCDGELFTYLGVFVAALMLLYEHYLVHKNLSNIPKAFFQTNGYLGFVFLCFIIVDYAIWI